MQTEGISLGMRKWEEKVLMSPMDSLNFKLKKK